MANTDRLGIPVMEAAQAQKHVTFNEAMDTVEDTLGRSYGSNGSYAQLRSVEEELSGLSGSSVSTTIQFPDPCLILGCSLLVTAAITGATSFDLGDGSTVDLFGNSLGVSFELSHVGMVAPTLNSTATSVTLTANGSNFTGGSVRVSIAYLEMSPPTS